jgi:HK97 family phage major capsid protein
MKAFELRQKRANICKEARAIIETAQAENRDVTAEELKVYEEKMAAADALEPQIARLERIEGLESRVNAAGDRVGDPLPHEAETKRPYSLLRALNLAMNLRPVDGLEGETSQEIAQRCGKKPRGFFMPLNLKFDRREHPAPGGPNAEQRALDTTAGGAAIATILSDTWIEYLRNATVVRRAGARVLTDMQGNFAIPRQSGTGTAYWVGEGGAPTPSNQVLDQILFSPKTIGAYTDFTRRFLEQTSADVEQFVREDLAAVMALGIDLAALNGSGASNQPLGILQDSTVPTVAIGANGGPPTWAQVVQQEITVEKSNALMGSPAYVMSVSAKGALKTTPKIGTTFPTFLMEGNEVNGYPALSTNQIPSNLTKGTGTNLTAMVFGSWDQLILAFWSGLDVLVDPYTGGTSGTVRIVELQDCDLHLRHPQAFDKVVDLAGM